jgi:hypothetical protein
MSIQPFPACGTVLNQDDDVINQDGFLAPTARRSELRLYNELVAALVAMHRIAEC